LLALEKQAESDDSNLSMTYNERLVYNQLMSPGVDEEDDKERMSKKEQVI